MNFLIAISTSKTLGLDISGSLVCTSAAVHP